MIGIKRYYLFGKNAGCSSVRHASAPAGRGGRTRCRFIETAFPCETYQFYQFYNLDRVCYPQSIRPGGSLTSFFKRLFSSHWHRLADGFPTGPGRRRKRLLPPALWPGNKKDGWHVVLQRESARAAAAARASPRSPARSERRNGICWFLGSSARSFWSAS